jgi:drug/metabolite transporter (DMT)-like permease
MNHSLANNRSVGSSAAAPHLVLLVVQVLFGTWPILGKIALRSMSSASLVGFRICGAAIIFALLQRHLTKLRELPKRVLAWITLSSLLGVVLNQLLFVKGLSYTTVINSTLLSTVIPVFTLTVSIVLGYDRFTFRHLVGIALAVSGVVYLVDPWRADFSAETTLGNALIVFSSFCYGAYIAVSRGLVREYGALNVITWIFMFGAVMTLPIAGYAWSLEQWQAVPPKAWFSALYIVLIPTVLVYYLNAWALTKVKPSVVAVYIYLQPLLAFGLAPIILGESWNSRTLLAAILIFAGVATVTVSSRRRRGEASEPVQEVSEPADVISR